VVIDDRQLLIEDPSDDEPEDLQEDPDELEADIVAREQAQHDFNDPRGYLPDMVEGYDLPLVRRGARLRNQVLPTVKPAEKPAPVRREQNRQVPEYIDEVRSVYRENGETWVMVHWVGCGEDQNSRMTKKHATSIGPSLRAMVKEKEAQQEEESKHSIPPTSTRNENDLEANTVFGSGNRARARLGSLHACLHACDLLGREDLTQQMFMAAPTQPMNLNESYDPEMGNVKPSWDGHTGRVPQVNNVKTPLYTTKSPEEPAPTNHRKAKASPQ